MEKNGYSRAFLFRLTETIVAGLPYTVVWLVWKPQVLMVLKWVQYIETYLLFALFSTVAYTLLSLRKINGGEEKGTARETRLNAFIERSIMNLLGSVPFFLYWQFLVPQYLVAVGYRDYFISVLVCAVLPAFFATLISNDTER